MHMRLLAIIALASFISSGAAQAAPRSFDLLNNTTQKLTSMRILGGELLDFAPLEPGEARVFHVETENEGCDILVRARFKGGDIVSSTVRMCDPAGLAFKDWGSHWAIVFRRQLGL